MRMTKLGTILSTLAILTLIQSHALAQVKFTYDETRISDISVNGQSILGSNVGTGGVYLIGSSSGADIPETNYSSVGSAGGIMTNGGPPFRLTFWQKGPSTLGFRVEVGPVNRSISTLSLPFDFGKQSVNKFAFNGNSYRWECTGRDGARSGSGDFFSSIPQGCVIKNAAGQVLGKVGVASQYPPITWGEVSGPLATIRVNVLNSRHVQKMWFANHFGTNNMEFHFGSMRQGETAFAEGEIAVSISNSAHTPWIFQTESYSFHQIGRRDADGWSVRVGDPQNRFMNYGPYTTAVLPGKRMATFRLMLDNTIADNNRILTLDVFDSVTGRTLASRSLTRREFTRPFQYQNFDLGFAATIGQRLEFRTFWHGGAYVRQDYVQVQ